MRPASAALGLWLLALLGARGALADDQACGNVVARLESECAARPEQAAIKGLASERQAEAKKANKQRVVEIDQETRELNRSLGVCSGMEAQGNPRTCSFLGSTLSAYLQTSGAQLSTAALADQQRQTAKSTASEIALEEQPDRQTSSNKSGTSAQLDPVESIQPITLAGGALTLSGTRSGTKGVGTITVNPLALARSGDAVSGRLFDVSVSAPFDLDTGTGQDLRYVSARIRVNMTAPISAAHLQQVKDKFTALLEAYGKANDELQDVLESAADPNACAQSVMDTKQVSPEACGVAIDGKPIEAKRQALYDELAVARREADSYYFGLDLRLDSGDPTGTVISGDKGTHILGGLAGGRRIEQGPLWDFELRGRAAGDYFKTRDDAAVTQKDPVWSMDWGAAFILSGRLKEDAKQRLAFGFGVEGRQAFNNKDAKTEQSPTNYVNLNLMAVVPAMAGGDLGLAISIPVNDSLAPHGAVISLSTDLGLLDHSGAN